VSAVIHDDAANMPLGAGSAVVHDDAGKARPRVRRGQIRVRRAWRPTDVR
jgi:hypothetical protein